MRSRLFTTAVTGALLAAGLTGCGSDDDQEEISDLSVGSIEEKSKEAMGELRSVTYSFESTGSLTEVTAEIDGDCFGKVSRSGATADFIRLADGTTYMKANEAFWQAQAGDKADQIIAVVGDKYVKEAEGKDSFGEACDVESLLERIREDDTDEDEAEVTKGDVVELDGTEALELTSVEDGKETHIWVDNEDAYILKVDDGKGTVIQFADFDEDVDPDEPAEDEYVDLGGQ